MASLAKITLIGNLGGDPETRYTPQGTLVVNFRMAVNNRRRDQSGNFVDHTNWFSISAFGRIAETMVNLNERGYLVKGKQVYVDGRFEQEEWTGQDGQPRTTLRVTVSDFSSFQLLGSRDDGGGDFGGGGGGERQQPQQSPQSSNYGSDDMDDVPF